MGVAPHDQTFRVVLAIALAVIVPLALRYRLRAASTGESLDRSQEGRFILYTLRPFGLLGMIGLFAFVIDPRWMAWSSVPLPVVWRWVGVGLGALGGGLLLWTFHSLGASLTDTVVTRKEHTLVTHGPYRWVRHPLYGAMLLAVTANGLAAANWFIFVCGSTALGLIAWRTRIEERKLIERFGDDYREYMATTGKFLPRRWDPWVLGLAVAVTAFHMVSAEGYGIFRDELYYLACADRLDWGYVDHPPLVAVIAWLVKHTLGTSLHALRLLPALAAGGLVLLAASMARQFGGDRFARVLAGLAVALAPWYLSIFSIYSMNWLDLLVWSVLLLLLTRILGRRQPRLWLAFGAVAGLGLQNKLSVLFLGFGVAVGLVMAREWRHLRDPRLWLGGLLAGALFLPHILWQAAHDWPTLEFVRNATETKNLAYSPLAFLREQVLSMSPAVFPLWAGGLFGLAVSPRFRAWRAVAWIYPAVLAVMLLQNAKPYYLAPIYPVFLAAGAVLFAGATRSGRGSWVRLVATVFIGLLGMGAAPLAKPLVPADNYEAYAAFLGVEPGTDERHQIGRLPQFFADMHGWEALARQTAAVLPALSAAEREQACIFTGNYGDAGAIEFFGPSLGLPPAMSGHNSYWLWGPGECGEVLIVIGSRREQVEAFYADVTDAGRFECVDCMPFENGQPLWIARDPHVSIVDLWPRLKHYD